MKKIIALALAALLTLGLFAGCSLTSGDDVPVTTDSANGTDNIPVVIEEQDRDAAVITVGDQVVTMGEYMDLFDTYASYYVSYGYDIYSDPTALQEFQDFIVDLLAEEAVIAYQAEQAGFGELGEEQLQEVEDRVAEELDYLLSTYRPQAEEEAAADPTIDVEARTQELIEAETEYYTGTSMSYDEFVEWIRAYYEEAAVSELFREETLKDITVDDAAIQEWYDTALAEQTTMYTEDGGAYKDAEESFEKYGDSPVVYVPEGYSRVLHILIAPEEEPSEEYNSKLTEMDSLAAEYGELAFEAALSGEDNPRLSEILSSYRTLEQEAEELEQARMADSLATANSLYAQLEEGADFRTLMMENTQDNSILSFDIIAEKGLLISNRYQSDVDWSNEVKTAFATMEIGQYSQVIQDTEGCHIIYYLSDEPAGAVDIDTVRDAIEAILLTELQDAEWAAMLETWKNDGSVTINEDLVHSYGAAA